jgi:hypothetical protein
MRDLLNVSFSFGPEAFHEAFCDTIAILVAQHDNGLIERVLAETKGKLNTESFLSFLAEDMGSHHNAKDPRTANVFYLRNALNSLRVEPFEKLPYLPDNRVTGLGREAHSYSRIYTGALYDILVGIYEHLKKQKWSASSALAMARDALGELLIRSVELGPIGESSLEDFAWAMVMADRIFMEGAYEKIIIREFRWRRIFTTKNLKRFEEQTERLPDLMLPEAVIDPQSALRLLEMNRGELRLPDGEEFTVQSGYRDRFDNRFITFKTRRLVKLVGTQFGRYAGATVPLYGGVMMMFDKTGILRHYLYRPAEEEDVTQAHQQIADMLDHGHLAFSAMVGPDGSGMLERTAIITVGTDDKPTNRTLNKIEPGFAPQKKKLQIPMLDQALGVVRVSMQVMGQPKIKDYAEQWLKALKRANGNGHH